MSENVDWRRRQQRTLACHVTNNTVIRVSLTGPLYTVTELEQVDFLSRDRVQGESDKSTYISRIFTFPIVP